VCVPAFSSRSDMSAEWKVVAVHNRNAYEGVDVLLTHSYPQN